MSSAIETFLSHGPYAVVGASRDRAKYGNKVLRAYLQHGMTAYPVNPNEKEVEGRTCYPNLAALPEKVSGVSIVTPPAITEKIVEEAAAAGIFYVWMQPGAESPSAINRAEELGMTAIAGGPCILVALRFRE